MKREAYCFVREFHRLDQLAIIDLTAQMWLKSEDRKIFNANYTVIDTEKNGNWLPHIPHNGIVQVVYENDRNGFDTAVFERLEEV